MHPQDDVAKGVLGRIADELRTTYGVNSYSLSGLVKMLEGEEAPEIISTSGVITLEHHNELNEAIRNITLGDVSYKSVFGETFAQQLQAHTLPTLTHAAAYGTCRPTLLDAPATGAYAPHRPPLRRHH